MVDPKPPGKGRGSNRKSMTSATTPVLFRLGYTAPPILIGRKTMDPLILAIREKNNKDAYASKTWSCQDWNVYETFGIQDFSVSWTTLFNENRTLLSKRIFALRDTTADTLSTRHQ